MDWHLAPALVDLRAELNELNPGRDKRSDGTIGDTAHQATGSKHNPNSVGVVRAFDGDNTGPWPEGVTFDRICNMLADRHRRGVDNRLQNIIWNRRIASHSWGWTWRAYGGSSPHTEHGHFEVRDSATYWNKRGPWGLLDLLEDEDVALAKDQIKITPDTAKEIAKKAGEEVSGATLLQYAVIYARRGARDADKAVKATEALEARLAAIEARITTT